jgi:copper chaperone NosL
MKTLKIIGLLTLLLTFLSCEIGPQKIAYGQDGCHYCRMTIVDSQYAAQIVTKKGKAYKFDATECMIRFMDEFDISKVALYLSNNYTNPGELIAADKATFLISENVPSPMGAFLSAFKARQDAQELRDSKSGELFTWEELLNHLN